MTRRFWTRFSLSAALGCGVLAAGSCGETLLSEDRVESVILSPLAVALLVGEDSIFEARAQLASGGFVDGARIFWSSANPAIATVDSRGRVSAVAAGSTRIAASSGGKSAVATLAVLLAPVATVDVDPASSGMLIGNSLPLRALAVTVTGDTAWERPVQWTTSNAKVATVSSLGVVQAINSGTVAVSATVEGVVGRATISVTPVPVASVTVTPPTAVLIVSRTVQLNATTLSAGGAVLTGRTVTWASSNTAVAGVNTTGNVTAFAPGAATITATSEGKQGSAVITVVPVPVASVSVVPATASLVVGTTFKLTAAALDSTGGALTGRRLVWTSAQPNVATVDSTGLVRGVSAGGAKVTATVEGKSATATVTVTLAPVARITIAPASVSIAKGASVQLVATLYDAAGNVLTGRVVTWQSGSSTLATVDANGIVKGIATGAVLISASSEGQRASATVTVR